MGDTYDVLEELKLFALGLNDEDHVDETIKNCPCDACRIVDWIIEKQKWFVKTGQGVKE